MFVVDTDGFVKVLSDADTDRILGIHMIGSVSIIEVAEVAAVECWICPQFIPASFCLSLCLSLPLSASLPAFLSADSW